MKAKITKKTPAKAKAKKTATEAKIFAKSSIAPKTKAPEQVKTSTKKSPAKKTAAVPARSISKKRRITFTYRAEAGLEIFLSGTFNNWAPTAKKMTDKKKNGIYTAVVTLAPGSYEYKFVIDGTWCADPECADWIQNDHGTLNSVKHVSVK